MSMAVFKTMDFMRTAFEAVLQLLNFSAWLDEAVLL